MHACAEYAPGLVHIVDHPAVHVDCNNSDHIMLHQPVVISLQCVHAVPELLATVKSENNIVFQKQ